MLTLCAASWATYGALLGNAWMVSERGHQQRERRVARHHSVSLSRSPCCCYTHPRPRPPARQQVLPNVMNAAIGASQVVLALALPGPRGASHQPAGAAGARRRGGGGGATPATTTTKEE